MASERAEPPHRRPAEQGRGIFTLASDLLAKALECSPDRPIHITMDRHGGRRYYAGLLNGEFPMVSVETVEESPDASRYLLHRAAADASPAPVALTVRDRCESWSLVTALASMAAKYVRELAMEQLNEYPRSGCRACGPRPDTGWMPGGSWATWRPRGPRPACPTR